jgi:hypothetical protein
MKKLLLVIICMGAIPAFAQKAFDGTWRLNKDSAQIKGNDKFSLQDGVYRCDTCVPKVVVKADGQEHKVSGSPYYDTTAVKEVNDHSIEIETKKNGKPAGTTKLDASDDGKTLTTEWSFISENGAEGHGKFTSDRVGTLPTGANKISGEWHPDKIEEASDTATNLTYKVTADDFSMSDPVGDSYTAKFDGKDYPYKGDPGVTSVSLRKLDENTVEETGKRNGKVIYVSTMTVNADGKTMKVKVDDKLHKTTANWTADKQ